MQTARLVFLYDVEKMFASRGTLGFGLGSDFEIAFPAIFAEAHGRLDGPLRFLALPHRCCYDRAALICFRQIIFRAVFPFPCAYPFRVRAAPDGCEAGHFRAQPAALPDSAWLRDEHWVDSRADSPD